MARLGLALGQAVVPDPASRLSRLGDSAGQPRQALALAFTRTRKPQTIAFPRSWTATLGYALHQGLVVGLPQR